MGKSKVASPDTSPPIPDVTKRCFALREHADGVREMFDRIATTYDRLNRILSFGMDVDWRRQAADLLGTALPQGPILDLCAGTLDLTVALERRFPEREIVATDFSREMLERGRSKVSSHTTIVAADAMDLPMPDATFAAVVCGFGVRNLVDPRIGLQQAHRCLKEDGVLVILELFKPRCLQARIMHAVYSRSMLPLLGWAVSGEAKAYRYLAESMKGFLSSTEFVRLVEEVGFREVETRDLSWGIASLVRGVKEPSRHVTG